MIKHLLLAFLLTNFLTPCIAQYVYIPDIQFRRVMRNQLPDCFDNLGRLDTNCAAKATLEKLTLETWKDDASNLEGLQYFKKLKKFECIWCNASSIPKWPEGLRTIHIVRNLQLKSISYLPSYLDSLYVFSDSLKTLPILPTTLRYLHCSSNLINGLKILPPRLEHLTSYGDNNGGGKLKSVPELPQTLQYLNVSGNQITQLPTLPKGLLHLNCSGNSITKLPQLPKGLQSLYCAQNMITCLPYIPLSVKYIDFDPSIKCLPVPFKEGRIFYIFNSVSNTYTYSRPVCQESDTSTHCILFPEIKGRVYLKDKEGKRPSQGIKVQLSDGSYTTTDDSGYYHITLIDTGKYSLTVLPPTYYTGVVNDLSVDKYDTVYVKDFELSVAQNDITDLKIDLSVDNPSWFHEEILRYKITYKNIGTVALPIELNFDYDKNLATVDSCSSNFLEEVRGKLSFTPQTLKPGEEKYIWVYCSVQPGSYYDTLKAEALLTGNGKTVSSKARTDFTGSNVKVLEGITSISELEVQNNEYITYTLRLSTDNLWNKHYVTFMDSLFDSFIPNSLELLGASHPVVLDYKNQVISFRFGQIDFLKPFENDPKINTVFLKFRIKVQNRFQLWEYIHNAICISVSEEPLDTYQNCFWNDKIHTFVDPEATEVRDPVLKQYPFIYPNPSTGEVFIKCNQSVNLKMFNNLGEKVLEQELQPSNRIDISTLKSGLYLYKIDDQKALKLIVH